MTTRLPLMGVTLAARQFTTYVRQLQQAQRVTDAASGATVNAARAAQTQIAGLNQLTSSYLVSGESAAKYAELTKSVGESQELAAQFQIDNAKALQQIRATADKDKKAELRTDLQNERIRQQEQLLTYKKTQIGIRNEIADIRARAAQSRDAARQVVNDRKLEAAATREATAATKQYAAAQAILGASLLAVGIPALALTKNLVTAAAETERFATAADIAAKSRGASAAAIEAERDELDSMYVSANQANRLIQQMAISNVGFAKASEVAAMAQDLSVASTLKANQVYEILTQAITTATTVRLRELGVVVDRGRIMNWYAAQLGKEADELTAVEERLGVYNYLVRISEGMQGAFAAQLDKTSGQLVIFDFYLTKIKETLGTTLLPAFNSVLKVVWQVLKAFQELPQPVQQAIAYTTALSGIVFSVVGAYLLLKPAILAVTTALGPLIKASGLAAGAGGLGKLLAILTSLHPAMLAAKVAIAVLAAAIITDFGGLRQVWDQTFGAFLESVRKAFVESYPWIIASVRLIAEGITSIFDWLDKQVRKITGGLVKDDWGFEFDPEPFFVGAASMMGAFAAGLVRGFNEFILPNVIGIVDAIAAFLIGQSPPKEGPLADIKKGGIEIIQAWSQGMESVSLKKLRKLADEVHNTLQQALYQIQDTIFDIQTQELELDKALYPFEDALFLARAAADLVIIPLEQQTREMERQIGVLEEVAKKERERAEAYLRILEKQADAMKDVIEADEERLEVIDHEIFIEEQRLKIMGQATSTRLLELKGQKRITEDQLKDNRLSLQTTEDQITAEEERLDALVTAAEAQIKALQAQVDAVNANIELEEERVTLAQEALRLEEARQAQARLALLEETRFWEEEQRMASHYMDIIGRIPTETSKKTKKAADDIKKSLEGLFDFVPQFEEMGDKIKDAFDIEEAMRKMREAFLAQFPEGLLAETERLLGELGKSWGKLGEAWALNLEDSFKTFFEETLPTGIAKWLFGPKYDESFDESGVRLEERAYSWGELIQQALWEGFWGEWRTSEQGINAEMAKLFAGLNKSIEEGLKSAFGGALGNLASWMPSSTEMSQAMDQLGDSIAKALTGGTELTGQTGGPEGEISTRVGSWFERVFLEPLQEYINTNLPNFQSWVDLMVGAASWSDTIQGLLPDKLAGTIGLALLSWILDMEPKIQEGESPGGLIEWGQAFLDFPENYVLPTLTDSLELITGILLPWISPDAEERIIENLITWGNAFINWVEKDSVPYIAEKLDILLATIITWVTDVGQPKMVELGEDLSDSMVKGLEDATEANQDRLKKVGKEMLEGIKDGLDDEFDDFRRWLKKKLQAIIDAVKGELGIASPSKEFAKIGVSMVQGLGEGFGEEADTWVSRGMKDSLDSITETGRQLVDSIWEGAREEWPGFEAWLLDSIRRLTQEVRFEMGSMTSTVSMAPQNMTPIVNNTTYAPSYSVSANYARTQSEASIRDDIRMMMALG